MADKGRKANANDEKSDKNDFMTLPKYAYSDLTVFMRTSDKDYLNLTDYDIMAKENEHVELQSESPFVIMFCSLFYTAFKGKTKPYVCDVSFDELLELSGVNDKGYVQRFVGKFGENKELLAVLCAKKILDYQCGKVVRESKGRYSFYRQGYTCVNGKHTKQKRVVFTKDFYEA